MKLPSTMLTNRRRVGVGAFWLFLVTSCIAYFSYAGKVQSKPDGSITGVTSTTSSGCSCHGSSSSSTTLSLTSGSGSFTVAPGSTTSFTLTVANAGKLAAGTDIGVKTTATGSTNAGTLIAPSGSGLQVNGTELTHTSPKLMSGGQATFTFEWTAPTTTGTYYVQAAGNAVNSDNTSFNDQWNWLTAVPITVAGVQVTSPNTAVGWCTGTTQNITWTAGGITNVKIELSSDGGSNYSTLVASTPASAGSWPWSIPSNQATGTQYRIRISDVSNPALSDVSDANFSIQNSPAITGQPSGTTLCTGQALNLSVTATGSNLTYQWRKNGANITGANSSTYSINPVGANDGGTYDVLVSNACSTLTSSGATVVVNASPTITTQPISRTVCAGLPVTFSVTATGTNLTYQWRKGGNPLSGKTASTLTIDAVSGSDVGEYDVVVSGTCSPAATSSRVTLALGNAPTITAGPTSQVKCQGESVTFSVTATGTDLTYQWRKNGNPIPSAENPTYTIPSLSPGDAGTYTVVVNGLCSPAATSDAVTLTVNPLPNITTQPADRAVLSGSSATFTVEATGGALTYQWQKNGSNLSNGGNISGATSATLTLSNVQDADKGDYTVRVQNACGSEISTSARLSVIPPGSGALVSLNPSQVGFGTGRVGVAKEEVFVGMITNSGDSVLKVTNVAITGTHAADFAIVQGGGAFDLAPGATRNITLRFTPADTGNRTATLEITSNAKNTASATLQGRGARSAISAGVTALNFGTMDVGSSRDTTIVICNDGEVDAIVQQMMIAGPDAPQFQIVGPTPGLPLTLAPDSCMTVTVRFTATSEGERMAEFIVDIDGEQGAVSVDLNGTGDPVSSVPVVADRRLSAVNVVPNPVADEALITIEVARPSRIELQVVDSDGRIVRSFATDEAIAGTRSFVWDGRADDGTRCSSGMYRVVVRGGGELLTIPMVIVH